VQHKIAIESVDREQVKSTDTLASSSGTGSAIHSIWQRISGNSNGSNGIKPSASRKESRTSVIEVSENPKLSSPTLSADTTNPIINVRGMYNTNFDGLLNAPPPPVSADRGSDPLADGHTSITVMPSVEDALRSPFMASDETLGPSKPKIIYPMNTLGWVVLIWVIYIALSIVLTISRTCTRQHAVALICLYPPLICASYGGIYLAAVKQKQFPDTILEGDFNFSSYDAKPAIFVFLIAVVCELLGIGGGELIGPMLLSMGVLPQVSAATIAALSFFNTFSIVIDRAVAKLINWEVFPVLVVIGFCGGFLGRVGGNWFADTYHRPSLLVFALVAVLSLSCIFYIYQLSATKLSFALNDYCT
jgi:hypothetical protein